MPDTRGSADGFITSEMRLFIETQRLCFEATVTPDGMPNLSPKGTIRVLDDCHLAFCDIDSPRTVANLENFPWMEVNVVDPLSRRGFRFHGRTTVLRSGPDFETIIARVREEDQAPSEVNAVVILEVRRAAAVLSPG